MDEFEEDELDKLDDYEHCLRVSHKGDRDALEKACFKAIRGSLKFQDLINGTDSSLNKVLREQFDGDEEAIRAVLYRGKNPNEVTNGSRKRLLEHFDGDEEAMRRSIKHGNRDAKRFKDIVLDAECLPEHAQLGNDVLERLLGYLPKSSVMLPYMPYLRTLIQQKRSSQITKEAFVKEATAHAKLIRNADMNKGGWLEPLVYDESWHDLYQQSHAAYREIVHERLTVFLKEPPILAYSLRPEVFMREVMSRDTWVQEETPNWLDIRMMTIIKYRQWHCELGKEAADDMPLFGPGLETNE